MSEDSESESPIAGQINDVVFDLNRLIESAQENPDIRERLESIKQVLTNLQHALENGNLQLVISLGLVAMTEAREAYRIAMETEEGQQFAGTIQTILGEYIQGGTTETDDQGENAEETETEDEAPNGTE